MGNTNSCIHHFKEVLSSLMSGSSMLERAESGKLGSIEEQIEHSKSHWSQVMEFDSDEEEVAEISNLEVFKALQMHPTWGTFFRTFDEGEYDYGELVMGEKFAEGGQAELYEAQVKWNHPNHREEDLKIPHEWVLKVFKKGTFLRNLQSQWPQGYLQFYAERVERTKLGTPHPIRYYCDVYCGTLLKDGRFTFLLQREHEDLRSLIDRRMLEIGQDQGQGPFPKEDAELIMYCIARGMDWLHNRNIVHRDLKASNVLGKDYGNGDYEFYVADYECSIGVIGTGFWRAPEILQALKDKNVFQRPELFTKEVDVYGYGMTCYEILTGKLPFEGHPWRDYDLVLNGQRPEIPKYVDDWVCELVSRCWEANLADRPSFEEILNSFATKSATVREDIERTRKQIEQIEKHSGQKSPLRKQHTENPS